MIPYPLFAKLSLMDSESIQSKYQRFEHEIDTPKRLDEIRKIRRLLSQRDNPLITEVIDSGIVPKVVKLLATPAESTLIRIEAAWVLTNVASGRTDQTQYVVACGVLPVLTEIIRAQAPADDDDWNSLVEQTVWIIGNIVGDGALLREEALASGMFEILMFLIRGHVSDRPLSVQVLQHTLWALGNIFRHGPFEPRSVRLAAEAVEAAKPVLQLHENNPLHMSWVVWMLHYIASCGNQHAVIAADATIVRHLAAGVNQRTSLALVSASICALRHLIKAVPTLKWSIIQNHPGFMAKIRHLLKHPADKVRSRACAFMVNFTENSSSELVQEILSANIISMIYRPLKRGSLARKAEVAAVLLNIVTNASTEQLFWLAANGLLPVLARNLQVKNDEVQALLLQTLLNLLEKCCPDDLCEEINPEKSGNVVAQEASKALIQRKLKYSLNVIDQGFVAHQLKVEILKRFFDDESLD